MAYDALSDPIVLSVIALGVGLGVLTYIEVKYLRKGMRGNRGRKAQQARDLPDDAHNAVMTGKAVAESLRRGGVVTDPADELLREADTALSRRNYRVAIDLAERAKGLLKAEKARQAQMGDLAKLEALSSRGGGAETTKEVLTRDQPPNLIAAKFSIGRAEAATAAARIEGRDVGAAERLLGQAHEKFASGEYALALGIADHARKAAEGHAVPAPAAPSRAPPVPATSHRCPSCAAPVAGDDVFCRKCGADLTRTAALDRGA